MSVYNINYDTSLPAKMFLGQKLNIARYDQLAHPQIDKITKQMRGFFWQPEEINNIIKDKEDFRKLTRHEQHAFTSNLKRQILLDSVQGRAPSEAFTPVCSSPELEIWMQTWSFSETIHSYSYTHIIRNIYSNPSEVFDSINDIEEIVDCAKDISIAYDELIQYNKMVDLFGYGKGPFFNDFMGDDLTENSLLVNVHQDNPNVVLHLYEHKKRLWNALMSVNILEGIRFYVSFAVSWSFAERKLMEGNAKIIQFICRDENLHLASTQYMLRNLVQEDDDFRKIAEEQKEHSVKMFEAAVEQEKRWADYIFKDGSMIGLNTNILYSYVEYIARQRMIAVDLPSKYTVKQNPLPWTSKWISSKDNQPAAQEVNLSSYLVGGIKSDVDSNSFKGFKL